MQTIGDFIENKRCEVPTAKKRGRKRRSDAGEEEETYKRFIEFYETKWDSDTAYVPSDFIDEFGIDRHLARYYLMNMVWEKKLFRVKYSNKTFYVKRTESLLDKFSEFIWLGVKITK